MRDASGTARPGYEPDEERWNIESPTWIPVPADARGTQLQQGAQGRDDTHHARTDASPTESNYMPPRRSVYGRAEYVQKIADEPELFLPDKTIRVKQLTAGLTREFIFLRLRPAALTH